MKILVSDNISREGVDILRQRADVDVRTDLDPEQLLQVIDQYDALVVRSSTRVTAPVIQAGKRLKVIGRAGVGVDNIDVEKATEAGIMVINAPGGNTISAAEHSIALLTALARNIPEANASVKKGEWKREQFTGVELNQKILGVMGVGRIGGEVARRARACGLRILAYDPYISFEHAEKMGVEPVTLEELLRSSDFITLHFPLVSSTHHCIGEKELSMVKPGVRIINCARGGLIDEDALYRAMVDGRVGGAALDVFEKEPPHGNPLLQLENVIVTPHLGASTREAQVNVAVQVAKQILKALYGEPVDSAVNVPVVIPEVLAEIEPYIPLMRILGSFYMQLFGGPVDEIEIKYSGAIGAKPVEHLTASCLIGFLQVMLGEQVNYVNALHVAGGRGIRVKEMSTTSVDNFTNLVTLSVKAGEKSHTLSGTLFNGDDIRIVQIDRYRIEVVPSRHMLVCAYYDRPGVIGGVGTVLGEEKINIAGMQVGRQSIGGEAVMVLQVDAAIPDPVLKKLDQLEYIISTRFVKLPDQDLNRNSKRGVN